jgi:hypothetical protein
MNFVEGAVGMFWPVVAGIMYLFAGHYSFECMAVTAREEERFLFRDMRAGVPSARLIWMLYVLCWLPLRGGAWVHYMVTRNRGT